MKLLCFTSSLGTGGAERQMLMLIELLNKKDIVPYVLTYCDPQKDYPSNAKMHRYNVSLGHRKIIRNILIIFNIIRIRPDVIVSYCGDPNLLALLYKFFFRRCRVIVSERNTTQKPISRKEKNLFRMYKFADEIIANSYTQGQYLKDNYPQYCNKIHVICNYTALDKFKYVGIEKRQVSRIVVPSRYHSQKNTIGFIKALHLLQNDKECPPFECYWIGQNMSGDYVSEYYKQCVELASKLGITNLTLKGYTNNIMPEIIAATIICLPSFHEGFSNTLSEALCIGRPILASNVSDNSIMVKENWNGFLFDPTNIEEMAKKIKLMLLHHDKFDEFSKRSRDLAENLFDQDRFIEAYIRLIYNQNKR